MSETSAESLRVPPVRPPSCISMLAERLKCSNLQDTPPSLFDFGVDHSEARFMQSSARRPKAVNFSNDESSDIILISQQRSSATSSDVDGSPITCDSGTEDSSESWIGGVFSLSSSSRAPGGSDSSFGLNSSYQPSLQHCLSTSAPDGPALLFPPPDTGSWCDASASNRKSCCICRHRLDEATSIEDVPSQHQPPIKRSCRSQSASSNQKLSGGSSSRRSIARPIALRISQRSLYSPAAGSNSSNLSSTAYALVASGCVKLRNANATSHQLSSATSRLSWHHPIACGGGSGGNNGNRRYVIHPGLTNCSRHSVVIGSSGPEFIGDVKLRKPPSLACISTSTTSNPTDFSHHRLSAFTPTTQSRRMSLSGDEPESVNPISAYFSPDTVSSPCGGVSIGVPPHLTTVLPRPTVSAASSGFFQDSCSLSHSSCSSSTNSSDQHSSQVGNTMHPYGLSIKTSDDSTASLPVFDQQQQQQLRQVHHNCSIEAAKLRCQSQPAGAAGAPACACGSVASVECLSRQVGLKRRRCSHEVGFMWEADSGAFLFGSHQHVGSFDGSSFNPDIGINNSETAGLIFCQETVSVSPLRPQQPQQSEVTFPQESETAFLMSCRRKELSGLSEASEEEESNEAALLQQQYPSCCALEEYDAGTLTPPPQTRFRPIAPATSSEDGDNDADSHLHNHHSSYSTEGSPCSFKGNVRDIMVPSEDGEEDEVDDEDTFGAIAPGLNHRKRRSPMQTEEGSAVTSSEKFRELDIDMIEKD